MRSASPCVVTYLFCRNLLGEKGEGFLCLVIFIGVPVLREMSVWHKVAATA